MSSAPTPDLHSAQQRLLLEISLALSRVTARDQLGEQLAGKLRTLLPVDRLDLAELTPSESEYRSAALLAPPKAPGPPVYGIPVHVGLAGRCLRTLRPEVVELPDPSAKPVADPSLERGDYRAALTYPLFRDPDTPLGALIFASRASGAYGNSEVARAATLARLVEQALARIQLVEELQRSNGELGRFASVAAHELRAPLRQIRSFGRLLRDELEGPAGKVEENLQRVLDAGDELAAMMDALLEYSKVGRAATGFGRVDTEAAARRACWRLGSVIDEAGAVVEIDELPEVHGRESDLIRLFQNLVDNAIKFRQPGRTPRVRVWAEPSSWRSRFFVEDDGIGVDPALADGAFEEFSRLEPGYPGAGLGLAWCRKIVHAHGGVISLSVAGGGRGARVSFTLRTAPLDAED